MKDQHIPVQSLDPGDDEAVRHWAAQLDVSTETLRAAVAAIGTDIDKIKGWLTSRQGGDGPG